MEGVPDPNRQERARLLDAGRTLRSLVIRTDVGSCELEKDFTEARYCSPVTTSGWNHAAFVSIVMSLAR